MTRTTASRSRPRRRTRRPRRRSSPGSTTSKAGQQAVADQLNDVPALKGVAPDFDKINFVDPAVQDTPVKELLDQGQPLSPSLASPC